MKTKLLILITALIPVLFSAGIFAGDNDSYTAGKNLAAGDSTFKTSFGASAGDYNLFRISLENPHATLTDSLKIFHISSQVIYDGDTVKADTTPVRFKMLSDTGKSLQSDTLYQLLIVPPGESKEVFVWYPNPDNLYFVIVNAQYSTGRRGYLKVRGFNR